MWRKKLNCDFRKNSMITNVCPKVEYSNLVTSGNNPKITKRMLYSQYVTKSKPHLVQSAPIEYINNVNLFIEKYSFLNNITIVGTDIDIKTMNFIAGTITAQTYFEFLRSIFSANINYDHLPNIINGIYPLMPTNKGFYLKHYADIIVPLGSVYPRSQKPVVTNINFLYQY
jgi:hypothetical protein